VRALKTPTVLGKSGCGYSAETLDANPSCHDRDAWAGGFVAGLWQDKSLAECIEMGHWLARLGIQELGAA